MAHLRNEVATHDSCPGAEAPLAALCATPPVQRRDTITPLDRIRATGTKVPFCPSIIASDPS